MLVFFHISNSSSSVLQAHMEVHCIRECLEKQAVETFLKFYFIQLAHWTVRNVNKKIYLIDLKVKI